MGKYLIKMCKNCKNRTKIKIKETSFMFKVIKQTKTFFKKKRWRFFFLSISDKDEDENWEKELEGLKSWQSNVLSKYKKNKSRLRLWGTTNQLSKDLTVLFFTLLCHCVFYFWRLIKCESVGIFFYYDIQNRSK